MAVINTTSARSKLSGTGFQEGHSLQPCLNLVINHEFLTIHKKPSNEWRPVEGGRRPGIEHQRHEDEQLTRGKGQRGAGGDQQHSRQHGDGQRHGRPPIRQVAAQLTAGRELQGHGAPRRLASGPARGCHDAGALGHRAGPCLDRQRHPSAGVSDGGHSDLGQHGDRVDDVVAGDGPALSPSAPALAPAAGQHHQIAGFAAGGAGRRPLDRPGAALPSGRGA